MIESSDVAERVSAVMSNISHFRDLGKMRLRVRGLPLDCILAISQAGGKRG